MKGLSNILGIIGVLLAVYALIGRFIGAATIGLGVISIDAKSGLILANTFILLSLLLRPSAK